MLSDLPEPVWPVLSDPKVYFRKSVIGLAFWSGELYNVSGRMNATGVRQTRTKQTRGDKMSIETKVERTITLTIPGRFYGNLADVEHEADCRYNAAGQPVSDGMVFSDYADVMHDLALWFLDQTKKFGYRTGAFTVASWSDRKVHLVQTDNPADLNWMEPVLKHISDPFGFSDLFTRWSETDWG